jgi:hypothetical protein
MGGIGIHALRTLELVGLLAWAAGCGSPNAAMTEGEAQAQTVSSVAADGQPDRGAQPESSADPDGGTPIDAGVQGDAQPTCATSADPLHCGLCIPSPPRGTPEREVCTVAPGPPGATCCAESHADGSCEASYFDGTTLTPTKCMPGHP